MVGHTERRTPRAPITGIHYLPRRSSGFIPEPPAAAVDVIYLCSPNNPTGAAATRTQLRPGWPLCAKAWIPCCSSMPPMRRTSRTGDSPFHLRNSWRTGMRDRIPQLLQGRWLHRNPLRIHGGAEVADGPDGIRRVASAPSPLAAADDHEVRRVSYIIQRAAAALYTRMGVASAGVGGALSRQCVPCSWRARVRQGSRCSAG